MNHESNITQQKLSLILHRCLVELRNLALGEHHQQIHDLADSAEIIPSLMLHWEDGHLDTIRDALAAYQSKYQGAYDHLSILNMEDAEFRAVFLAPHEDWNQCGMEGRQIIATDPAA